MEKDILKEPNFVEELLTIFRSGISAEELNEKISDYHENDIAGALEQMTPEERSRLYPILGAEKVSEIFTYIEDVDKYIGELNIENAAKVISHMDSDDAVDVLEEMDDSTSEQIVNLLEEDAGKDVRLIMSYDDDEIGSKMTTNLIVIKNDLTIRAAMRELVRQAGENDNIFTIYVTDKDDRYYGAIDLKDLIVARSDTDLEDLIVTSYPYVGDHEIISDCIERIKDYAEDSIPVLSDDKKIVGIITSQDIVEVVDDELGEDYAKLAGLTSEEDLNEKTNESMKKRLPWLVILLLLGIAVSTVVGVFEKVVAA
ncbi:MAG: magnesium transporter, partial [Clostridiales bacterium]|nr:magnesium transporter [Clostridiales bacterium]